MKTKKIMSIILAIALLFCFTTVAFAAGDGTIEVKNTKADQTYTIYKLFDQTYDKTNNSYAYTIEKTSPWYDFFATGAGSAYVAVTEDPEGYYAVTWKAGAEAELLAPLAIKYAIDNSISATDTPKTASTDGAVIKFEGLDYGYYLVDSTLGALCALNSTNSNVEILDKNSIPSITKKVEEETGSGNFKDTNDAEIGETVTFQIVVNTGIGAKALTIHDTMAPGFTFNNDIAIVVKDTTNAVPFTNLAPGVGYTFEITITAEEIAKLEDNTDLVVTYTATVNDTATIRDDNKNTVYLTYGENNTPTLSTETNTKVWDFSVKKVNNDNKLLPGAQFELYSDEACTTKMNFEATANGYLLNTAGTAVMTTDANGIIKLQGLDSGTYYLKETVAPDGYNLLTEDIKITIDADGKVYVDDSAAAVTDNIVEVVNNKGNLLPHTGGIGTTLFYVLGGTLCVTALVLLVYKKRTTKAQ